MKTYLNSLFIVISVLIFIGCGGQQPEKKNFDIMSLTMKDFKSNVQNDEQTKIIKIEVTNVKNVSLVRNTFDVEKKEIKMKFFIAFDKVINSIDTKYFAIMNPGISNIEGFPLNNLIDLDTYMFPKERGFIGNDRYVRKDYTLREKDIILYILPVKKKNIEFNLWSVAELKKDINFLKAKYKIR